MNVLHHSLAYCILMFFYKFAQLSKKYLFKHRTYKVAEIEMRVAEFKSTRRRKKKINLARRRVKIQVSRKFRVMN